MDERRSLFAAFFRQQSEIGMPSYIFSDAFNAAAVLSGKEGGDNSHRGADRPSPFSGSPQSLSFVKSPSAFTTAPAPKAAIPKQNVLPLPASKLMKQTAPLTGKRAMLAELFHQVKTCQQCGLGKTRKNFVFGTGNPEALFMVIGEAPGEEEDLQGQPFVGAAGALLTKMLSAIDIDRKKHVFIANILKCRPPRNRNPELTEVRACSSILSRQIEIIAPKVILLLGRIAAHSLLDSTDSIGKMRSCAHEYKGIPVFVTYHPAALLRNDDYRRPAWEDLQKLQLILRDAGVYDAPTK
ncbi:MAG: uracil-DNA glycosylase [Chitinivibrionales bacterium]